jgi:K+-sensing histidine kinase KdpD
LELLGADPQKVSALRKKRTASPAALIERHARAQAHQANRDQDLVLDLRDRPVPISEDYLAKIVDEVVQNAFKFSEQGTPVSVTLADGPGSITLVVGDRGRGFSTEHITRVGAYMQFDRKMHEQQGIGLGLSIAKRLTELHGGAMTVTGDHFRNGMSVLFDASNGVWTWYEGAAITLHSDTSFTVKAMIDKAGLWDITVKNADGAESNEMQFNVVAPNATN